MTYFGGQLLPNATIYAIWWGKPSDFPADAREGIDDFLENLDGSAYLAIADQYMFGQKTHTHFGGNLFDSSAPPVQVPATPDTFVDDVVAEVNKVLTANGMKADPAALYAVYVSNFPNENFFCAFHNFGKTQGTLIHIIYVPNDTSAVSFCGTNLDPFFTPNRHSEATRAMANSTAHEVMESITDPNIDGWINPTFGTEIGDPCNFIFQTPVPLADSSRWKIQEIWSNEVGGCVQGAGRNARVLGAFSRSSAITTFDIPAAAYGTFSQSTNILGAVVGYYQDASFEFHAFLRDSLGNIATIDPPGTGPGGAFANSINAEGAIAGNYFDTNFAFHGFVRDSQGNFTTLDLGAGGASANSINDKGVIAGSYPVANGAFRGFVRDALGNFVTFDAPGAVNAPFGGTAPLSINVNGAVTGYYLDANFLSHGFVRGQDGTMSTFDALDASEGTLPQSINDSGTIAGYFTDANLLSVATTQTQADFRRVSCETHHPAGSLDSAPRVITLGPSCGASTPVQLPDMKLRRLRES
jgi:uncharacterized membrane protein